MERSYSRTHQPSWMPRGNNSRYHHHDRRAKPYRRIANRHIRHVVKAELRAGHEELTFKRIRVTRIDVPWMMD